MLYRILWLLLIFSFVACKKKENKLSETADGAQKGTEVTKITHSIGEVLTPEARRLVNSWQEYDNIEQIIVEYYDITPNKATQNAHELVNAAQQLKDSIRVELLNVPELKVRLHVMYTTGLRLKDMQQIASIGPDEIEREVSNLVGTWSSINSKINNIVSQKNLENELNSFRNTDR